MTENTISQLERVETVIKNNPDRGLNYLDLILNIIEQSPVDGDENKMARSLLQYICSSRKADKIPIEYLQRTVTTVEKYRLGKDSNQDIKIKPSNRSETVTASGELLSAISDAVGANPERFCVHGIITQCATYINDPHPFISFHAISVLESCINDQYTRMHTLPYLGGIVARAGGVEGKLDEGGTYNINTIDIDGSEMKHKSIVTWDNVQSHALNILTWIFIYTPIEHLVPYILTKNGYMKGVSASTEEQYTWNENLQFESVSLAPKFAFNIPEDTWEKSNIDENDIIAGKPTTLAIYKTAVKSINKGHNERVSSIRLISAIVHHINPENEYPPIEGVDMGDEKNENEKDIVAKSDHTKITTEDIHTSSGVDNVYINQIRNEFKNMLIEDATNISEVLCTIMSGSPNKNIQMASSMALANLFINLNNVPEMHQNITDSFVEMMNGDDMELQYITAQTMASILTELEETLSNENKSKLKKTLEEYENGCDVSIDSEIYDT